MDFNRLTPNDPYMGRTAPLTSKRCILYIYSTNVGTEYFKHALCSPFFALQNAVCFIMLTCLVPVLFTFYIQGVLKLKKNNSGAKGLMVSTVSCTLSLSLTDSYFLLDNVRVEHTVRLTISCCNSQVSSPSFSTAYNSLLWAGKTLWSHKTLGSTPIPLSERYHFAGNLLSSSFFTFFRSLHEILRPLKGSFQCYSEHIWSFVIKFWCVYT